MKSIIIALALLASVLGCAPDDQMFDISALTSRHQTIFIEAMLDLNERYPDLASFALGEDANSVAVYGEPFPGKAATVHEYRPFTFWMIVFLPNTSIIAETALLSLTTHELCHVIGFEHWDENPDLGHC